MNQAMRCGLNLEEGEEDRGRGVEEEEYSLSHQVVRREEREGTSLVSIV